MGKQEELPLIYQRINKRNYFLKIFRRAEKKYGKSEKRLAAEEWGAGWKVLISTIMSAQSRDETTIEVAEKLFFRYGTLVKLSKAKLGEVLKIFSKLNYNRTKAKHVVLSSKMLVKNFGGRVPSEIGELVKLPGVGRKTANLIITEVFGKEGICVDTHVHRLSNVLGFVKTNSPNQTEMALRELVPQKYWGRINRLFVLWGKDCAGRDREKLLECLEK
jgi:endonuclease III